jgi:small subunit ribosomal protein S17
MKKNNQIIGRVISDKNDKTITVVVETYRQDSLYGKRIKCTKKYRAHDEGNVAKTGDKVLIEETRPLSRTKRYTLIEVLQKAVIL